MSKYCPICKGLSIGSLMKYCTEDGTALVSLPKCSRCGEEYLPIYKFCMGCGTKIEKKEKES